MILQQIAMVILCTIGFSLHKCPFEHGSLDQPHRGLVTFSSALSLRAANKKSGSSPNEVDTSFVKSQLIYFHTKEQLLHIN